MNCQANYLVNRTANSTTESPRLTRIAMPVLGMALFVTVGPIIGQVVHSAAAVLFEVGRLSSAAVQIFCY